MMSSLVGPVFSPCTGLSIQEHGVKERMSEECDHKGHYRVGGNSHIAIRYCVQCGKSWRLPTQGDYLFGDHPVAEWEPIREGLEVESRVLPDYDERRPFDPDYTD